jgi:hypothetical protein
MLVFTDRIMGKGQGRKERQGDGEEERKWERIEKKKRVEEEEGERKSMVARGGALQWQPRVTYQDREHLSSPYPVPLPFRLPLFIIIQRARRTDSFLLFAPINHITTLYYSETTNTENSPPLFVFYRRIRIMLGLLIGTWCPYRSRARMVQHQ